VFALLVLLHVSVDDGLRFVIAVFDSIVAVVAKGHEVFGAVCAALIAGNDVVHSEAMSASARNTLLVVALNNVSS
jgi:hypothetical protein